MSYVQHQCPNCGAAVPAPGAGTGTVRCEYCATELTPGVSGWAPAAPAAVAEPLRDPDRPRLWVGHHRYAVLGRLATGDATDVFLARRDTRLTELVVLKLLRKDGDAARLPAEWEVLTALGQSKAQGAPHFTRLLPQPVSRGAARLGCHGRAGTREAMLLRWRSGFVHTFDDLKAAYPPGVPATATVWLWKRILEQLGWVHRAGFVHGAITSEHLLVHARDHGVALIGWSRAAPFTPAAAAADLAMSTRCVRDVVGRTRLPEPLSQLLERPPADAWRARDQLDAVAREVFGPPTYIRLSMPGWN